MGVGFARFQRAPIGRSKPILDEWFEDMGYWLQWMELCAELGRWPQNDKACDMYGGCQFREVCQRNPSGREFVLRAKFAQRVWDPLKPR